MKIGNGIRYEAQRDKIGQKVEEKQGRITTKLKGNLRCYGSLREQEREKDDWGIIWASIGGKTILHEPTYTI